MSEGKKKVPQWVLDRVHLERQSSPIYDGLGPRANAACCSTTNVEETPADSSIHGLSYVDWDNYPPIGMTTSGSVTNDIDCNVPNISDAEWDGVFASTSHQELHQEELSLPSVKQTTSHDFLQGVMQKQVNFAPDPTGFEQMVIGLAPVNTGNNMGTNMGMGAAMRMNTPFSPGFGDYNFFNGPTGFNTNSPNGFISPGDLNGFTSHHDNGFMGSPGNALTNYQGMSEFGQNLPSPFAPMRDSPFRQLLTPLKPLNLGNLENPWDEGPLHSPTTVTPPEQPTQTVTGHFANSPPYLEEEGLMSVGVGMSHREIPRAGGYHGFQPRFMMSTGSPMQRKAAKNRFRNGQHGNASIPGNLMPLSGGLPGGYTLAYDNFGSVDKTLKPNTGRKMLAKVRINFCCSLTCVGLLWTSLSGLSLSFLLALVPRLTRVLSPHSSIVGLAAIPSFLPLGTEH